MYGVAYCAGGVAYCAGGVALLCWWCSFTVLVV